MPLVLYDQNNKLITDRTPIMTEHNGTEGEEVTVLLYLINKDKTFRYDDVVIKARAKSPVMMLLNRVSEPTKKSTRIDHKRLGPGDVLSFKASVRIPPGTKASFIRGSTVKVDWKKYPI